VPGKPGSNSSSVNWLQGTLPEAKGKCCGRRQWNSKLMLKEPEPPAHATCAFQYWAWFLIETAW
jgi:hypothetical protein